MTWSDRAAREHGARHAAPQPAWLAAASGVLSLVLLILAGHALHAAGLGGIAFRTRCSGGVGGALLLVVLSGVCAGLALLGYALRRGGLLTTDPVRGAWFVPAPLVVTVLGLPGLADCRWAAHIAALPLFGTALATAPGGVVTGAAAWALGLALTACVTVTPPVEQIVAEYERLRGSQAQPRGLADLDL